MKQTATVTIENMILEVLKKKTCFTIQEMELTDKRLGETSTNLLFIALDSLVRKKSISFTAFGQQLYYYLMPNE